MTQDEPMFTVHSSHLNTGLRGVPVGTCRTSFVTPTEGVHYCGYPIAELAHFSPEDIVFLLFNKELPTPEQSAAFKADLSARGRVPDSVAAVFHTLPRDGHPMDWLSIGIHTLGMMETTGDWKEDALNLIARMPRMMGLMFRIREGRGENIPDDDLELNMVQRFVRTLEMDGVDDELMEKILATYLVLHMDHGGGNLSTFTGKAIASGHATVYASIAGAMNALSGPLHGRANQSCLEFVLRIGTSDPDEVEAFVRGELAAKRPVFGFGHAVLRAEDPRATVQFALGERLCPDDENFKIIRTLREVAPRVLSENKKISNPNANVDIASGALLHHVGFKDPTYYTTFFGWARVAGIGAQIIDERTVMRSGKGTPIYRPKYIAEQQELRHLD
ncbi:MAG: citrate/2-methylcitrate synthase [Candidatus Thermoplasmatota archaeon]|jgi:citrate synthase|nr:citrate/2-methylcitrate synthase [Candidatus Thermoplasmatota archaeon]GIR75776.1 MAG: type I citrate synthase [Candidatus Poseidoniales archaeon]MEC7504301.1 citrate/2-methylcitrate synthase [Candidatus Thermoplasmatota archaeon]MEC7600299.1 citrate/2-methylcitrate synthase [Candidatus Thermoplasmatota archaeon]MEC8415937.1 citrate/2-methylcitrate synthase [Candidatus Thermoplasmatota archaeon]